MAQCKVIPLVPPSSSEVIVMYFHRGMLLKQMKKYWGKITLRTVFSPTFFIYFFQCRRTHLVKELIW